VKKRKILQSSMSDVTGFVDSVLASPPRKRETTQAIVRSMQSNLWGDSEGSSSASDIEGLDFDFSGFGSESILHFHTGDVMSPQDPLEEKTRIIFPRGISRKARGMNSQDMMPLTKVGFAMDGGFNVLLLMS